MERLPGEGTGASAERTKVTGILCPPFLSSLLASLLDTKSKGGAWGREGPGQGTKESANQRVWLPLAHPLSTNLPSASAAASNPCWVSTQHWSRQLEGLEAGSWGCGCHFVQTYRLNCIFNPHSIFFPFFNLQWPALYFMELF